LGFTVNAVAAARHVLGKRAEIGEDIVLPEEGVKGKGPWREEAGYANDLALVINVKGSIGPHAPEIAEVGHDAALPEQRMTLKTFAYAETREADDLTVVVDRIGLSIWVAWERREFLDGCCRLSR